MWDGMTLIPGRDCGGCTVCCVFPTINKPEIQKQSGVRCRHCHETGCGIYDSRPPVCRAYYCAWRTVDIFGEDWRPDRLRAFCPMWKPKASRRTSILPPASG